MKRELIMLVCAAAASAALAITATKEYVDRRDAGISESATNYTDAAIAPIAMHAASNEVAIANVETKATDATITNAMQDVELASHASQLSQLFQSIDGKVPTSRTVNGKALTSNISLSANDVGAWPAVEGSEWGMGSAGLTLYLGPGYLSGSYCFGIDSEWHVMRRRDVEDATNATLAAAMTYTDSQVPSATDIANVVTRAVPAWALAAQKPTYTAAEVGAYPTNETMYVDYIGDIGFIYGDYWPSGVWDFGDGCIRIANCYQFSLHMAADRQADGIEIFDIADPTIKTVIPINGSDVATKGDIPPAVSNIVTTALVRERLGVYLYVGADGGIYVHTNED